MRAHPAIPSGNGEGGDFLGSFALQPTNANGKRNFTSVDVAVGLVSGEAITATATDPNGNLVDSPDPVTHGQDLTYTVTVANSGPEKSVGTQLTQTLSKVTFVSATPSVGTCALNGN